MKIHREGKPSIIIGKRVVLGQIVGAICAWAFWLLEVFTDIEVPAAMVTQGTTLLLGLAQIWAVNQYGVTTMED